MAPIDEEFERLKRREKRHLGVLNTPVRDTSSFTLRDEGLAPGVPRPLATLRTELVGALRSVHDPEIPLNIYDLGLIYDLDVSDDARVEIRMTLTAPGCPVAGALVQQVHDAARAVPGVAHVTTQLVWDPPWSRERMSEAALLALGLL